MNTFTRFGAISHLLSLFTLLVFVSATSSNQSECKANEFWYNEKSTCLPNGGLSSAPSPPSEKSCPPAGWYWSTDHSCCVPSKPISPSSPPPQCSTGWDWTSSTYSCQKKPSPTSTSRPSPSASGHRGRKKSMHGGLTRNRKRTMPACPLGFDACPISGLYGLTSDFECLDTVNELESCGGCLSVGKGQDCTAIEGSWNVGCVQGTCAVYNCKAGYKRSLDGKSCTLT